MQTSAISPAFASAGRLCPCNVAPSFEKNRLLPLILLSDPAGVFIGNFFYLFFHPKPFSLHDPKIPSRFKNHASATSSFPPHHQAPLEGTGTFFYHSVKCLHFCFLQRRPLPSARASSLCRGIYFFTSGCQVWSVTLEWHWSLRSLTVMSSTITAIHKVSTHQQGLVTSA